MCGLQIIVAERGPLVFVFNFSPFNDYEGFKVTVDIVVFVMCRRFSFFNCHSVCSVLSHVGRACTGEGGSRLMAATLGYQAAVLRRWAHRSQASTGLCLTRTMQLLVARAASTVQQSTSHTLRARQVCMLFS